MPTFAENRGNLSNASTMLLIGGVPAGHAPDLTFQPSVANYGLHDTFYVMTSSPSIQYCDKVNASDGDTVPTTGVHLPHPLGRGEVFTIDNGVLRTNALQVGEVMLVRNGSPSPPATLKDAVFFDPNLHVLEILPGGARLQLKWGDAIIVKSPQSAFHSISPANPTPAPLHTVNHDWVVYVCLPEFHGGPEAYNALRVPGVYRSIRERVEECVTAWDAAWDPTTNRVILTRNGRRQQAYEAFDWDVLEEHTAGVRLPAPWWANAPSDSGDSSALEQLSGLAVSGGKRAAEDSGKATGGKRPCKWNVWG